MLGKLGTCKAIKVTDTTADRALLVKVILAVTLRTDVLIKGSLALAAVKLSQNIYVAKLTQMAVETTLARWGLFIHFLVELLYRKLAVGIATKKTDKRFPTRCFISLFSHLFSP
jgi:hypothetical protein